MSPSLADKPKSLGAIRPTVEIKPPPPKARRDSSLEHVLDGCWLEVSQKFDFYVNAP